MIIEINTPDGPKSMLLGYQTLKHLVELQKSEKNEFELIEAIALHGFNIFAKRKGQKEIKKDQMLKWFDDPEVFMTIQKAVTDFSENFTPKESPKKQTPNSPKARK